MRSAQKISAGQRETFFTWFFWPGTFQMYLLICRSEPYFRHLAHGCNTCDKSLECPPWYAARDVAWNTFLFFLFLYFFFPFFCCWREKSVWFGFLSGSFMVKLRSLGLQSNAGRLAPRKTSRLLLPIVLVCAWRKFNLK